MKLKMKILISFICLAAFPFQFLYGSEYKQKFNELFTKGDAPGQEKLLEEWEKTGIDDPEFYVAYFNYCVKHSRKELIWTDNNPAGTEYLKLTGKAETGEDVVAYMNFETNYDKDLLEKGFTMIAKGINKYPDRLDMRFGEIYMFGESGDYKKFTSKIIQTVEYSAKNNNKWIWDSSKQLENPKEFMLGAIQEYQIKLYNTGNDALLDNMKNIAEAVLKYYPDNVESLSNLSLVYSIRKEYGKALEVLSAAEKIAPQDCIVLNNIANIHRINGDKEKSLQYYELITKYGNASQKEIALTQMSELSASQ